MRKQNLRAVVASALLVGVVAGGAPAEAASGVPYTVKHTFHATYPVPADRSHCRVAEVITVDGRFTAHVNATREGLTDEQITLALREDDPEGIFNSVSVHQHGTFVMHTASQVYSGTFNIYFGFNDNQRMDTGTYRFKATGKSDQGTQLNLLEHRHGSHTRQTSFERLFAKGCPPE